jgi:hypothetical protein
MALGCSKYTGKQTSFPKETGKENSKFELKPNQTILSEDVSKIGSLGKSFKSWDPEESDIGSAESILIYAFDRQKDATVNRVLGKTPDDYNQQYVGAENENGDKYIWVNLFCKSEESHFKEWKTKLVHVQDGGKCFVNVKINLTKKTFEEFKVNGDA